MKTVTEWLDISMVVLKQNTGDGNLTIENCKTYIKGDWDIQVDGNKN